METPQFIAFWLSIVSLLIGLLSLWATNKQHIIIGSILYNALSALHYILIGNYTQGSLQLFSSSRIYLAKVFEGNRKIAYIIILIGFLFFLSTYREWHNILSFLAFSSGTLAFFFFDRIPMRLLFINGGILSLIVALISESWPIAIFEAIGILLNIRAIVFHFKNI